MKYEPVSFWPDAYHVFQGKARVGIVNCHTVREGRKNREIWYAHNKHFFSIDGEFPTRAAAASTLNTKPIKHDSNAFK